MKFIRQSSLLLHHLLTVNIVFCMATCKNAEYEINGECCPMCDPGKRVKTHCEEDTSTTCDLCPVMTYTSFPNGLTECLPCSVCDSNNGLREKQPCTSKSNTVCGPLPGYYCIIGFPSTCEKATKHSTCSPGQYINQTGTEFSDTVCYDCSVGSYSNGTFCKLHTNCESLGQITVKAGTETSDTNCSSQSPSKRIIILPFCGLCVVIVITWVIIKIRENEHNSGFQTHQG